MWLPSPPRSICRRVRPLVRPGTGEICRPFAARALRPTSSESSPAPARDSTANLVSRESVLPELSVGTPPEDCVQAETDATTHATGIAQTNGTRMMSPLRARITFTPPRDWSIRPASAMAWVALAGDARPRRLARRRRAGGGGGGAPVARVPEGRSVQGRLLVEHRQRPREHRRRVGSGVHPDGVLRAGLDAEAADDAAQLVDLEAHRELLDRLVLVLARLDVDALRRAGRRAHVAGHAARLSVDARDQAVHAAVPRRVGLALVGVVDRRDHVHARALAVEDLGRRVAEAEQVRPEVLGEHSHSLDRLAQVEPLAEAEVGLRSRTGVLGFGLFHQCVATSQVWLPASALMGCAPAVKPMKKRIAIHSAMPTQARPSRPAQRNTAPVITTFKSETGSIIFQPSRMIWS